MFVTSGNWIKVIAVLCCATLPYGMIKSLVTRAVWYLYSAVAGGATATVSSLYFGSHLSEVSNNYTFYFFSSERQSMGETPFFLLIL